MKINQKKPLDQNEKSAKKIFRKLGTCSQTFAFILNREFAGNNRDEEKAMDCLAGGIMQQGYQCGMLWGASMAVSAEAHRRRSDKAEAMALALKATRYVMDSFYERNNTVDCSDITHTDFNSKLSFFKYMITGKFLSCFTMAEQWADFAIEASVKGLEKIPDNVPDEPHNCAMITALKMGATQEQAEKAAGYAGGMGLSGNGCGALATAIWLRSMQWNKDNPDDNKYPNPYAQEIMEKYYKAADYEVTCSKVCGKKFNNLAEHSDYIKQGGCAAIIDAISS